MSEENYDSGDNLMSMEQLDRDSPEIWSEQMPGLSEYISKNSTDAPLPAWSHGFTAADLQQIQQLGSMSCGSIVLELKKLHDQAYQLGVQEAKEMSRGKYLNIFGSNAWRKGNK